MGCKSSVDVKPGNNPFRQEGLAQNNNQKDCRKDPKKLFHGKNFTGHPAAHALARYRCFLPDLAGLAGLRRAGPGISDSNIFVSAQGFLKPLMIRV